MTTPRADRVVGVADQLHRLGRRTIDLLNERRLGDRRARTWQVVSTWTCAARHHGTISARKNYDCTCPPAVLKTNAYEKDRRLGLIGSPVPSIGVVRRLRALAAAGYPRRLLAQALRVDVAELNQISSGRRATTTSRVHCAIVALYDELAGRDGPSTSSMKRARAKGWLPPAAWDDESIDDPTTTHDRAGRLLATPVSPSSDVLEATA